jgi:hypothetical protein
MLPAIMEGCVYCGAETTLYVEGTPVCSDCDDRTPRERLEIYRAMKKGPVSVSASKKEKKTG